MIVLKETAYPNVKEIVKVWLKYERYDGLCNPILWCCCSVDDLAPCKSMNESCQAAYKRDDGNFCIRHSNKFECMYHEVKSDNVKEINF